MEQRADPCSEPRHRASPDHGCQSWRGGELICRLSGPEESLDYSPGGGDGEEVVALQ